MAFEIPKIQYTGKIKEITLGKGDKAVTVGGESSYPFHLFEGEMPHKPKIAMEVYDVAPDDTEAVDALSVQLDEYAGSCRNTGSVAPSLHLKRGTLSNGPERFEGVETLRVPLTLMQ